MSEFKRKRLNVFRRLLIKVGKKILWWRFPKADKLLLNSAFMALYNLYNELIKDKEKVNEEWFLIGNRAGINVMNEMFNLIEMMVSKSLIDLIYLVDASWALYMGKSPTSIEYLPPDDEEISKIVWTWDNCVMCTNAQSKLKTEILENNQIASIAAGVYKAAFDIVEEHVGNTYLIDVKITKSRSWGDPTCEMTATFTPVEKRVI